MSGPSEQAIATAVEASSLDQWDGAIAREAVRAAYPVIRADVIAEVVAALKTVNPATGAVPSTWAADWIERELGVQA